ncbi:MAG: DUF1015 family protein [Arenicellales bacterium]|nr:DUF1015 family protein [Arenicellales bacterium]
MITIRAFDGFLVKPDCLKEVVSPAYDSLTSEERHLFGIEHPLNYINAMHSVDEYPADCRPSQAQVLQTNASNLKRMLDRGDFEPLEQPAIFLYRLAVDDHQQTAVVCEIPIDHYDTGIVLKHENTRADKEDLLTGYLDVVGASSSPVCLAYEENLHISGLIDSITRTRSPLFQFSAYDNVVQTLWKVDDKQSIQQFEKLFLTVEKTYLTDGHHRFAAGSRFAEKCRARNPGFSEHDNFNHVLVALFSANQLRILPFNRCVRDISGMSPDRYLDRIRESFLVEKTEREYALPTRQHEFGMCLHGDWYRLILESVPAPHQHPLQSLDVTILHDRILDPVLGITDVRTDDRLEYIPGDKGLPGLEQKCEEGWAVGFACYPTSIGELMRVADSGEVMPPKSTYFDPKMRSGLFLRLY